ncbi:MAG: superoxide dismutase family protein [Bacteroidota bacterium]
MKKIKVSALGLLVLLSYNCKEVKKEAEAATEEVESVVEEAQVESVKFMMEPKSDSNVKGEVTFTAVEDKVMMMATLSGLTAGEHAIHIHEKADCSSADGKSTGGHWNPTFQPHAKWGAAEGYHKGDIGNFTADAEGNATVEFSTDEWCMGCGDDTKDIIGKAVIVHQGVDDFTSQPSGAAGARVSCTGIIQ